MVGKRGRGILEERPRVSRDAAAGRAMGAWDTARGPGEGGGEIEGGLAARCWAELLREGLGGGG